MWDISSDGICYHLNCCGIYLLDLYACLVIFVLYFCHQDVVFKLWYKYLQVTGTAFTGSLEGTVPTKAFIFYHRDAELLDVNKRKKSGRKVRVDDDDENEDEEGQSDEGKLQNLFFLPYMYT